MGLDLVPTGKNPPDEINVIIEIPKDAEPVKYEVDKATRRDLRRPHPVHADALPVQLRLRAAHAVRRRRPGRRAGDPAAAADPRLGDPLPPGRRAAHDRRGRQRREDPRRADRQGVRRLQPTSTTSARSRRTGCERIGHFFEHYKDLEKGKWVKLDGWGGAAEAKAILMDAIARFNATSDADKPKF